MLNQEAVARRRDRQRALIDEQKRDVHNSVDFRDMVDRAHSGDGVRLLGRVLPSEGARPAQLPRQRRLRIRAQHSDVR